MRKLILFVALVSLAAWAPPALAGPKARIPETRLILGQFHEGQLATGVFEIFNDGDEDLVIDQILPG